MDYLPLRVLIITMTFIIILAALLTSCGYEGGDLDRGLECLDGCSNPGLSTDPQPGPAGKDGTDGKDGKDGRSCSVKALANGATIFCDDGTNAVLYNGTDGRDGEDARQPLTRYTITQIVDPCGKESDYDEVLLRMESGDYLALYYDHAKKMSFLTTIGQGSYITTDNTGCRFSIDSEGQVTW